MQNVIALYAISENGVIGKDNTLPFNQKSDLKRFKRITYLKTLIMGRKTYESLPSKLKMRKIIVISSRQSHFDLIDNVLWVNDISAALAACKKEKEVFIVGGAEILKESFRLGVITEIWQTYIHKEVEGDVKMQLPSSQWILKTNEWNEKDTENEYDYSYQIFCKLPKAYQLYALMPMDKVNQGDGLAEISQCFLSHTDLVQHCYKGKVIGNFTSIGLLECEKTDAVEIDNNYYTSKKLNFELI